MMKKRKSITRFAFNLFWLAPVLVLVLFACSSPNGEQGTQGDEMIANERNQKTDSDKVLVKATFTGDDGQVYFLINLDREKHIKFDVLHDDGTHTILLDGIQKPNEKGYLICNYKDGVKFADGHYTYKLKADKELAIEGSFDVPAKIINKVSDASDKVFAVVEKQPEFPGGTDSLYAYLSKSVIYPEQAKKDSIAGRVFVGFIIEKDGSIGTVKLLRGIGGGCDEEAMRAVAEMPKWIPGEQRGQAVRVQFNLPIKFTLE